jgi:hypothetical protein
MYYRQVRISTLKNDSRGGRRVDQVLLGNATWGWKRREYSNSNGIFDSRRKTGRFLVANGCESDVSTLAGLTTSRTMALAADPIRHVYLQSSAIRGPTRAPRAKRNRRTRMENVAQRVDIGSGGDEDAARAVASSFQMRTAVPTGPVPQLRGARSEIPRPTR